MNAFEKRITKNMEEHGWFTEIHEDEKASKVVDILAYRPKTGKMFYGNLSQVSEVTNLD